MTGQSIARAALWVALFASSFTAAQAEILVQTLPNGLTVILEEDHSRPIVSGALVVKGGSRTETPDLSGLSHYYEHLIFRGGSREQEELEFRRVMQQLGEESGGYTSDDYTNYGFTVPSENLDEALRRSTDAWMGLNLTQEKVDKERRVVMEEYNQGQDRPDYRLYYAMLESVFQVHPYRVSPIGRREVIEGASLETFRTFYEERYVPNHMILALVGDLQAEPTLSRVRELWGGFAPGKAAFEQGLIEPEQREFRFRQEVLRTAQARATLAFPIPPANHRDLPALELLAAILANDDGARLWQVLKVRDDLVRSVSAYADRRADPGLFAIDLEMDMEDAGTALDKVVTALADLAANPPLVEEVNRARTALLAARTMQHQTPFRRAEALAVAQMLGTAHDVDRYPALLAAVTRSDIARVARTYLAPQRSNLALVRPTESEPFDPTTWLADWVEEWRAMESRVDGSAAVAPSAVPGGSGRSAPERAVAADKGAASGPTRIAATALRRVMPNGARLVVRPDPSSEVVGAVVLVRGGQWAEPDGKDGLANFVANLLDKGAAGRRQTEIAQMLADLGAHLQVSATADYISLTVETPAGAHRNALEILADVAVAPTLPPEEREKVRADLLAQIAGLSDRPFEALNQEFYDRLYRKSPYRKPLLGTEESITRIDEADLRGFLARCVVGANVIVSVSGPVDPAAIESWAQSRFGRLPAGKEIPIDTQVIDGAPKEAVDVTIERENEQVVYNTGWPTVSVTDPDYVPLRAAVAVLGDRFFFKYVYDKGVAYRSWFYQTERLGAGSAQNEMGVSPAIYRQISTEVVDDLARFTNEPIPAEELGAAQRKLISRHFLGLQTNLALAQRLAFYELSGLGIEEIDRYPVEMREVTPEEAGAAARRYLPVGRTTRVAIGKASEHQP